MSRISNIVLILSFVIGASACGGGWSGYYIPVDTELKPFVAPEADELVDDASEEDEGDYEDYEDEEDAPATK